MKTFIFLCAVILNFQVWAQRATQVNGLSIQGLDAFSGQYVSVFYVSGRTAVITTEGARLQVFTVLTKSEATRTGADGIIDIPSISVPRVNGRKFNFIYIVVHQQDQIFLKNPDGTYPVDVRVPGGNYDIIPAGQFKFIKVFPVEFNESIHTGGGVSVIQLP